MSEHIYKTIEITGSSPIDMETAVKNALTRASKSIDNLRWFHITDTRGSLKNGSIDRWQVTIKLGFAMNE